MESILKSQIQAQVQTKAEIITIGDEILTRQIVDTNSAWLGTVLNEEGIEVTRINSISDTPEAIVEAIEGLYEETQLVIVTVV